MAGLLRVQSNPSSPDIHLTVPAMWVQKRRQDEKLKEKFDFDDASIMRRFVTEVLSFQEDANHHGSLLIENDSIRVEVWTHDVNDVTELDREYAAELSDIYGDVMGTYSNVG